MKLHQVINVLLKVQKAPSKKCDRLLQNDIKRVIVEYKDNFQLVLKSKEKIK